MTEGGRGRVCVLTSVHPPFDARVFHRQARSSAAAGFDVTLIAPGAPRKTVDGVRLEPIPAWGGRAARPLRWPLVFWKALRAKAGVYHFHDPELLPWGVILHWVSRKPVIYDSHEYLREDIEGKQWIPARLRPVVAAIASKIEAWSAARLSAVIVVTDDMADRFKGTGKPVVVVRNLPPAPEIAYPPAERKQEIAYAGLMNVERGLDILYETAVLVRARVPAAEFNILGTVEWDGAPAAAKHTQAEWAAAGVRFAGTVPPGEVAGIISQASVGWLPRSPRYKNNLMAWPNKLVEYMAVGLPIVASDLPLQARIVREASCGLVVDATSPPAHADAICELLTNTEEARQLGENGRRTALESLTWEGEGKKLQTLYAALLKPAAQLR